MKKIGLHMDALVVIVVLFVGSFGFNVYQRYQYMDLLQAHIDLQWSSMTTGFSLSMSEVSLRKCEAKAAEQQTGE